MASATRTLTAAAEPTSKRRAACDECRQKKLKCAGERPTCSRCAREHIQCVYSVQKPMGRPKKRRRSSDRADEEQHGQNNQSWPTSSASNIQDAHPTGAELYAVNDPQIANCTSPFPWELSARLDRSKAMPLRDPAQVKDLGLDQAEPDMTFASMQGTISEPGLVALDPTADVSGSVLLDTPTSSQPLICACLGTMFLCQDALSTMPEPFTFPFALGPLRSAMRGTAEILACKICPLRCITAMQNTQSLGGLFMSIAERFAKVLASIDVEATRAEICGETKKFRLADLSAENAHLHTGGLSCAAAFSVDLAPGEWKAMSKKVVRSEVFGPSNGAASLKDLLAQMRARQASWHAEQRAAQGDVNADFAAIDRAAICARRPDHGDDHLCLKMIGFAESIVEGYEWS